MKKLDVSKNKSYPIIVTIEAEDILNSVLRDRQFGYISDVSVIFRQHQQSTWRQYNATPPQFPKPFYNGSRRAWSRKTLKDELIRRMTNMKAA